MDELLWNRKSSFNHVLGGAPPSRPLARLSSNARVSPRFCRCRARHAPDRPRPALRGSSSPPAVHRAETTTFRRDDDPHARFRRRRRPRQLPRARPRAPRAPSRPHHARARAGNPGRRGATHPARLRPGATFFFFFWVFAALARFARAAIRGARRLHFVSSLPDPLPLRDPSTSPPRARRSSPWAPRCSSAPRSRFPAPPPPRHPTCTLASAAPPGEPSPPPSSSAAPHRHPPRRRSSPPSAPRRFRVQRQVLVQRFDTSRNGSRRRSSRRWRRFCSRGRAPRESRGTPSRERNDPNSDSKTPPRSSNRR